VQNGMDVLVRTRRGLPSLTVVVLLSLLLLSLLLLLDRRPAGLRKEGPDPRRASADVHLHELARGAGEERDVGLSRHGLRQQRLSGARRS
jgi:hypothetical protein